MEPRKPTICLAYHEKDIEMAKEIMAGIEEEGLFYERWDSKQSNPVQMALEACEGSQLGVGIGILDHQVVVQCTNLKEFHPLFSIATKDIKLFRCIGINAARYIKGIPFKNQCTV